MFDNLPLIISLISLGFFGGFSHCMGMCGPFVLTQVSNRLQKTPLEKFSNFQKLKNLALLPYHLGRITTYSFLGFFCSFLTKNIQDFTGFRVLSATLLVLASLIFLNLFFKETSPSLIRKLKDLMSFGKKYKLVRSSNAVHSRMTSLKNNFGLPFKSITLEKSAVFFAFFKRHFSEKISLLFQDPQGLKGYVLGIILGFIPCGLLYGAFVIAAAITQPILAAVGMMLFGISTFPSLFLTASGGYVFLKIPEFKFFAKIVILINAIMLLLMAIKLIN